MQIRYFFECWDLPHSSFQTLGATPPPHVLVRGKGLYRCISNARSLSLLFLEDWWSPFCFFKDSGWLLCFLEGLLFFLCHLEGLGFPFNLLSARSMFPVFLRTGNTTFLSKRWMYFYCFSESWRHTFCTPGCLATHYSSSQQPGVFYLYPPVCYSFCLTSSQGLRIFHSVLQTTGDFHIYLFKGCVFFPLPY